MWTSPLKWGPMWLSVEKEMWSFLHSFLVGSLERLGMWWIYPKLTNNSGEEKPPQFRLISHKLSRWALFAVSGGWGFGWGGMHTVVFFFIRLLLHSTVRSPEQPSTSTSTKTVMVLWKLSRSCTMLEATRRRVCMCESIHVGKLFWAKTEGRGLGRCLNVLNQFTWSESYGLKFCKIWEQRMICVFIPRDGLSN